MARAPLTVAYIVLAHTDAHHIGRLARRLCQNPGHAVHIHVDAKVDIRPFLASCENLPNVSFVSDRERVSWGGFSAVEATMRTLGAARLDRCYDRYVLLQGLDYPVVSNQEICNFFQAHKTTEFIRACNVSRSGMSYLLRKIDYNWYLESASILCKIRNRLNRLNTRGARPRVLKVRAEDWDIYWGSAQWALTGVAVDYLLNVWHRNSQIREYFRRTYAPDEMFFQTVLHNSPLRGNLSIADEEPMPGLANWRNLHYFEYEGAVRVFDESDLDTLLLSGSIFFRKANTERSSMLLDLLDSGEPQGSGRAGGSK